MGIKKSLWTNTYLLELGTRGFAINLVLKVPVLPLVRLVPGLQGLISHQICFWNKCSFDGCKAKWRREGKLCSMDIMVIFPNQDICFDKRVYSRESKMDHLETGLFLKIWDLWSCNYGRWSCSEALARVLKYRALCISGCRCEQPPKSSGRWEWSPGGHRGTDTRRRKAWTEGAILQMCSHRVCRQFLVLHNFLF